MRGFVKAIATVSRYVPASHLTLRKSSSTFAMIATHCYFILGSIFTMSSTFSGICNPQFTRSLRQWLVKMCCQRVYKPSCLQQRLKDAKGSRPQTLQSRYGWQLRSLPTASFTTSNRRLLLARRTGDVRSACYMRND